MRKSYLQPKAQEKMWSLPYAPVKRRHGAIYARRRICKNIIYHKDGVNCGNTNETKI